MGLEPHSVLVARVSVARLEVQVVEQHDHEPDCMEHLGVLVRLRRTTRAAGCVSFTLRGQSFYQEFNADMVEAFSAAESDVEVSRQSWGDYWDRLSTQIASGQAPDVMTMDDKFIA